MSAGRFLEYHRAPHDVFSLIPDAFHGNSILPIFLEKIVHAKSTNAAINTGGGSNMVRGGLVGKLHGPVKGVFPFLIAFAFPMAAGAVTKGQADTAIQAFNNTYWNASNKTFFKQDNKSGLLDYWMWAHAWETEMDAYERTQDAAYLQKIKYTYLGFTGRYSTNLSGNPYNDDIAWWILAAARAYELTGDTTYLGLARRNWDWMYSTQWDTTFGGGIWWQNRTRNQKNTCSTVPIAIAGFKLGKATGQAAYTTRSLAMVEWVRKRLMRPSGEIADRIEAAGARDSVVWGPLSYNHGTIIYAAYLAFAASKDSSWLKQARATADYFRKEKCDAQGIMPDEKGSGGNTSNDAGMYKTVFAHYLMRFIIEGRQDQYLPWMNANAESLWKNRRKADNLMWFCWGTPAPTVTGANGIGAHMATGMAALLNLIVIAETVPVSVRPASARDPRAPERPTAGARITRGNGVFAADGRRLPALGAIRLPAP